VRFTGYLWEEPISYPMGMDSKENLEKALAIDLGILYNRRVG